MLFNSFVFLLAFPTIFAAYYLCPIKWRSWLLLLISYAVYMNWVPVYALILLWVTLTTYTGARYISRNSPKNKLKMTVAGILTLLPLLFFKYYNFINNIVYDILTPLHLRIEINTMHWAAPIGISFFSFQAYGYLADVYYRRIDCERNLRDYALFISFFPQIASGPISKAKDLLPQIKSLKTFDADKATQGLQLLLWGLFLKVVLADRLGLYVDSIYDNYTYQTGFSLFVASLCYSLQIYGDFAGYSLMAIGVAKVLGFDLINNFNRPYFATSITDFWHRWHISLSIWLRDYVYIPLGGSRCSKLRTYWNIFATFLVSGIWHGANWTFIIWGIIHGVAQIAEKALRLQKYEGGGNRRLRIIITFLIVNFAWIFFRMPSITDACKVIGKIFTDFGTTLFLSNSSNMIYMLVAVCILFFKDMRDEFFPRRFLFFENRNIAIRWSSYLFLMFLILLTGVLDSGQFIYVNF